MLKVRNDVFLHLAGESEHETLHPCGVVEVTSNGFTAEIEEDDLVPETGQEILIYYNLRRQFVNQSARIDTVRETEPDENGHSKVLVGIETTGEPVSAEARQCYRVSTVLAELAVSFGGCDDCPVTDVSPTGFGVISPKKFRVGRIITATFQYENLQHTGPVCIQSMRPQRGGRFRYGVHCVSREFQAVVQRISMALQRQQLRRLSGLD